MEEEFQWEKSLSSALSLAKSNNKLVFADFYSPT